MPNAKRYLHGYSVGVGALIEEAGKVLLARKAGGRNRGMWVLPSGYVEREETIDAAVLRELREETGLRGIVRGVISVRNRVSKNENSLFIVFRVERSGGEPVPSSSEVDAVSFLSTDEIAELPVVGATARFLAERVIDGDVLMLTSQENPHLRDDRYRVFA